MKNKKCGFFCFPLLDNFGFYYTEVEGGAPVKSD